MPRVFNDFGPAMNKFQLLILMLLAALPGAAQARMDNMFDFQQKIEEIQNAVLHSPSYGIIFYTFVALAVFVLLIVVVMLLIMLLKR